MTVEELRIFINAIANKDQTGNSVTPDQYNAYLARANEDKFKQEVGYRMQADGSVYFDSNQVSTDALESFLSEAPLIGIAGLYTLPGPYRHRVSLLTDVDEKITFLDKQQFDAILNDPIDFPTDKYPYACMYNGKIRVAPLTVTSIKLSYLRKVLTPIWGFTIVNDEAIYNPVTSVQLEWPDIYHIDIARLILGYMGIQFNDVMLSQYAKMVEVKT